MFTIIITEKGGAERKEAFDRDEITVGRVQGNDLMLPKGNVSKQHARLLYRDGRFIVTDLKSTNGTYVNGRKIAQSTIVREGDKIYVGDFVLRLDAPANEVSVAGPPPSPPEPEYASRPMEPVAQELAPAPNPYAPYPAAGGFSPATPMGGVPMPNTPIPGAAIAGGPRSGFPGAVANSGAVGTQPTALSAGVQGPSAAQATAMPPGNLGNMPLRGGTLALNPAPAGVSVAPPSPKSAGGSGAFPQQGPPSPSKFPPSLSGPSARPSNAPPKPRESAEASARKLSWSMLLDRLGSVPARTEWTSDQAKEFEEKLRKEASAMSEEGELPESVTVDQLVQDLLSETIKFGPLGSLLEDDDVVEVICSRHDQLQVLRTSVGTFAPLELGFSSETAFRRCLERLLSGFDGTAKEVRLQGGGHRALAIATSNHGVASLVLQKRRKIDGSIEDLVRVGGLSRPMGTLLESVIAAKGSVLVVSSTAAASAGMLGAFASAVPSLERVVTVSENEDLVAPHLHVLGLGWGSQHLLRSMQPERVFAFQSPLGLLRSVISSGEQIVLSVTGSSLRQGLSRLAQQLAFDGLAYDAAREAVADLFDLVVEVHPFERGVRVTRVAEVSGIDSRGPVVRDIFAFVDVENNWAPTGVTPRVVGDLAQRGVRIEPSLFKRTTR